MGKTASVSVRMEPSLKRDAENILRDLGLPASQAVTLFYRQLVLHKGLPFEVKLPVEVTRKALEDAVNGRDLASFSTVDELFEDLGI
ncbi:MAG: type II toxin-antitoxin system RelB/DinJ family antitoxin [Candidatus Marinimicrobia bacterium]|nr:type II toxin-antitoxin system RelB/DinJ family antitoxin [Candidatus Neomarinimicrobiota bacterium]